jgi:O-antigen/teichoic acid export membrane protein
MAERRPKRPHLWPLQYLVTVGKVLPRGLPHVMVANIAQQALAFAGVLLIARLLPAEQFALVRIALAYAAVATILGAGGLTAPILRYCADAGLNDVERRSLLGKALLWLLLFSALAALCAGVLVFLSGRGSDETLVLLAYALQIPALAATSLLLVYLQAVQRFQFLAYSQIVQRALTLCLTAAGAWFFGLEGLLVATVFAVFGGAVPLWLAARPSFKPSATRVPSDFSSLARYSLIGMLITTVGQYADLLLLDWFAPERNQIGAYSLATIFFFAASALAGAVQSVATPHFTGLMKDRNAFKSALRRWSSGLIVAGAVAAIGATAFAWIVEKLLLSAAYEGLGIMVGILMLRFWIWCSYAVGGAAMVGIGAIKQGTLVACITTGVAYMAGYPLVLWAGVWGAAATQVRIGVLDHRSRDP